MPEQFSVLLPIWAGDRPDFLAAAFESTVDGQTRPPDQVVVVQDGPVGEQLAKRVAELAGGQPGPGRRAGARAQHRPRAGPGRRAGRLPAPDRGPDGRRRHQRGAPVRRAAARHRVRCGHRRVRAGGVHRRSRSRWWAPAPRRSSRPTSGSGPASRCRSTIRPWSTAATWCWPSAATPTSRGWRTTCSGPSSSWPGPGWPTWPSRWSKYRVGAGAYARRGGLEQLRTELEVQRRFRRLGFTTRNQYLRNVAVRGGYRLVPEGLRRAAYRRLIATYRS